MASQFFAETIGSHPPRFAGLNEHDYLDQFHGGESLQEASSWNDALDIAERIARKNCTVAYATERIASAGSRQVIRWQACRYNGFSQTFKLGPVWTLGVYGSPQKEARNG